MNFNERQERSFEIRSQKTEERTITGIGVPYGQEIILWDRYHEKFAPGSVRAENAILRYGHEEPIGKILSTRETPEGFEITAQISETTRGNEVWTLIKDGVLSKMSIGFEPVRHEITEHENYNLVTWLEVNAREFSVVEFPAYSNASITEHRNQPIEVKENNMDTTLTTLTDRIDLLERKLSLLEAPTEPAEKPINYFRSFGEYTLAHLRGDERAAEFRASLGAETTATTADVVNRPNWLGEISVRMDAKRQVINLFTRETVPAKGMEVTYIKETTADTLDVQKQSAQGAQIVSGHNARFSAKSAEIVTYAGMSDPVSEQLIRRTTDVDVVDRIMKRLAMKYARNTELAFRELFKKTVEAAEKKPLTTLANLEALTVDALLKLLTDIEDSYEDTDFLADGIAVSPAVWDHLITLGEDKKAFQLFGAPDNRQGVAKPGNTGTLTLGNGLTLKRIPSWTGNHMSVYSVESLVFAEESGAPTRLDDATMQTLTKQFAVYGDVSMFAPLPELLKPIKFTA